VVEDDVQNQATQVLITHVASSLSQYEEDSSTTSSADKK